jgi:3-dehydroquinate synthase
MRKILNFGHTIGHAVEQLSGYSLLHGEAVAIGMAVDARYACEAAMLAERDVARICALLERLGFLLWHPGLEWRDDAGRLRVLEGLAEFREHLGGELVVTMLEGVGRARDVHHVDETLVARAIDWLQMRARSAA